MKFRVVTVFIDIKSQNQMTIRDYERCEQMKSVVTYEMTDTMFG